MTGLRALLVLAILLVSSSAFAQQAKQSNLEDVLWDVEQQWLCIGPYLKPYTDCVQFRSKYWVDGFFEIQSPGTLRDKPEMVVVQSALSSANAIRPFPGDFKLVAVYGDVALATEHTDFKTMGPNGKLAYTSDSHVLRVFVRQDGKWRPAAAALVPVIPPGPSSADHTGAVSTKSPDEKLEKQLEEIDQKWMDAARNKKLDYLRQLFAERWSEIVGWDPTVVISKAAALDTLAKLNTKPGQGVFPDQFKLMSVYGNVALATDRRTRKWTDEDGHPVTTPHRSLLIFVKENGQWKSAGAALVPIATPK